MEEGRYFRLFRSMKSVKERYFVLVIGLLVSGISCHQWDTTTQLKGIRYQKVRVIPGGNGDGADSEDLYSIGLLNGETEIDGRRYVGWLHRRRDGSVAGGTLARATEHDGLVVPERTWVVWDARGGLVRASFPEDVLIQSH